MGAGLGLIIGLMIANPAIGIVAAAAGGLAGQNPGMFFPPQGRQQRAMNLPRPRPRRRILRVFPGPIGPVAPGGP